MSLVKYKMKLLPVNKVFLNYYKPSKDKYQMIKRN